MQNCDKCFTAVRGNGQEEGQSRGPRLVHTLWSHMTADLNFLVFFSNQVAGQGRPEDPWRAVTY